MLSLFLTILAILIAIGLVALLYYVVVWALQQFRISVPTTALRIGFTVLVLVVIYILVAGVGPTWPLR